MRPIRPRPICGAHNTFSPSIALWQHFVAPNAHLQLQLRSPFATRSTRDSAAKNPYFKLEDGVLIHEDEPDSSVVRRLPTGKGNWQYDQEQKAEFARIAISKNRGRKRGRNTRRTSQNTHELLQAAQDAYRLQRGYTGVVVHPVQTPGVRDRDLPWVPTIREHTKTAEERLELEIQAFHEYIRPNQAEKLARKHVIEQIRQHVQEILPEYVLEVFGSERTGVAFAGSDIDLRLVPKDVFSTAAQARMPPTPEERAKLRDDLNHLFRALQSKHRGTYQLFLLRWARYPLIALQDKASGLDVQLVLSNDTSFSREFMQRYKSEYSYLPQLYSVIKATLDVRGLADVFRGGIGSYSLYMMIVASLQQKPHPRKNAAGSLSFFMRFWHSLKAEQHGVSIEPAEFFNKSEQAVMHAKAMGHIQEGKTPPLPKWLFTLRDPADDTNDLGRKATAWEHIRTTFSYLDQTLHNALKDNTRASFLAPFVGPIYALQRQHRNRLTDYGRYVATAGSKYPVEEISKRYIEHRQSVPSKQTDAATLAVKDGGKLADSNAPREQPAFNQLAAIAQAIRQGEIEGAGTASKDVKSEADGAKQG